MDGNATMIQSAGCNIVQAVGNTSLMGGGGATHGSSGAIRVAITPRLEVLEKQETFCFSAERYFTLRLSRSGSEIFCDSGFTAVIVAPPGST